MTTIDGNKHLAVIEFIRARLDDDEAAVVKRTCIHCGHRTAPLRNSFGITGYTHAGEWEGRRCCNRLTGAEPVQDPDRALREVAIKREIVAKYELGRKLWNPGTDEWFSPAAAMFGSDMEWLIRAIATVWSKHPDYEPDWAL